VAAPVLPSLADLPDLTDDECRELGFPCTALLDLTEDEGRAIEAIMAAGPPEWVKELRRKIEAAQ
jgi:hypothetical protein